MVFVSRPGDVLVVTGMWLGVFACFLVCQLPLMVPQLPELIALFHRIFKKNPLSV